MKQIIVARALEYLSSIEKEAYTNKGYPRGNGSYIKIIECSEIDSVVTDYNWGFTAGK